MRCSALTHSLFPRTKRSEGEALTRSSSHPHAYETGYCSRHIFPRQFFCIALTSWDSESSLAVVLGNDRVVTRRKCVRGKHPLALWKEGEIAGADGISE